MMETLDISLYDLASKYHKEIKVNNTYQRNGNLWSLPKKRKLITSIIENNYVPEIILRKIGDNYEVIEGQQRCETITDFITGKLDLGGGTKTKVTYDVLNADYKEHFLRKGRINFVVLENQSDYQIRETFLNLNSAKNLNSAERRHAKGGVATMAVKEIMNNTNLKVFKNFKFTGVNRFGREDLILKLLAFEKLVKLDKSYHPYTRNTFSVKNLNTYLETVTTDIINNTKQMCTAILKTMGKMFPNETDLTKTSFQDLYIVVSSEIIKFDISDELYEQLGSRLMSKIYRYKADLSTGTKMTERLYKIDNAFKDWCRKNQIHKKV